jgi:hypothetical protein
MRARVLTLFVFATLTGCAPPLTVGALCERDSECPDPLTCALGRCRTECLADVDCAPGVTCVFASAGVGVCSLPAEASCSADTCPTPLLCTAGVCRASCSDASGCLLSQSCVGGVCVPDASSDAGVGDAGSDSGITAPDAGTGFVPAAACNADSDCGAAELCAVRETPRICRPRCVDHGDCPSGTTCEPVVLADDSLAYACSTLCLPGTSMGCRAGTSCRMIFRSPVGRLSGGPDGILACTPTTPKGISGCACSNLDLSNECGGGLSCEYPDARQCTTICELSTDCPNGPCGRTPRTVVVGGREYGVCPQPEVTPRACP